MVILFSNGPCRFGAVIWNSLLPALFTVDILSNFKSLYKGCMLVIVVLSLVIFVVSCIYIFIIVLHVCFLYCVYCVLCCCIVYIFFCLCL